MIDALFNAWLWVSAHGPTILGIWYAVGLAIVWHLTWGVKNVAQGRRGKRWVVFRYWMVYVVAPFVAPVAVLALGAGVLIAGLISKGERL